MQSEKKSPIFFQFLRYVPKKYQNVVTVVKQQHLIIIREVVFLLVARRQQDRKSRNWRTGLIKCGLLNKTILISQQTHFGSPTISRTKLKNSWQNTRRKSLRLKHKNQPLCHHQAQTVLSFLKVRTKGSLWTLSRDAWLVSPTLKVGF